MARQRGSQIYSPDIVQELKSAMAIESRAGEDDEVTFRQKVGALQRFLNHGISRFSIHSWHHALTALYHAYHPQHQDQDSQTPVVTRLTGLGDLGLLSRDVVLQREGGSLREADTQALKHLDNFLMALTCAKKAKGCVDDLHRFLYRYYYDPGEGRELSHVRSAQAGSRDSAVQGGPNQGQGQGSSSYEVSARQFGILTLEQMSGSSGHKLRRTVADMRQILGRWDRLMSGEGDIRPEDLEPESQEDLHTLSATAAFQPLLRLMPDIFAKFYKCLELLKQWWVLAHDIYPELPIHRPPTPSPSPPPRESRAADSDSELSDVTQASLDRTVDGVTVPICQQLRTVEEKIQVKEDAVHSLNEELQLLEERERHFESLLEAYNEVTAQLEEATMQRKELVTMREKESFPPHSQPSGTGIPLTSPDLNERVARAEREVQMLQFQQMLLRQDYMLQLEVRPSLIRFVDDLRIKVAEAQNSLVEDKMERIKLRDLKEAGETTTTTTKSASPTRNHSRKDAASPRSRKTSVISSSSFDAAPKREDEPPHKSTATDASRAAERKQELSRLMTRPMRETTSGSSVAGDTVAVGERQRRQSHPAVKTEERDKKRSAAAPAITIHRPSAVDQSAASEDNQAPTKSPQGASLSVKAPQGPSLGVKAPQARGKTSVPQTHSNRTETLFQRRLGKTPGNETSMNEKTREQHGRQQLDLSVPTRPRAKSDPHTARNTDAKSLKLKPDPEVKLSSKVKDNKSSTGSSINSDKSSQDSHTKKPGAEGKTSKTSSDNVGKSDVTSTHISKWDDTNNSKPGDTKNGKQANEHTTATSHTWKTSQSKKDSDVTSSQSSDNHKTEGDKSFPTTSVPRHADKSLRGAQPDLKEKDDRKRHTASMKPTEKNKITSPKPAQDDVRKGSNSTTSSQLSKQENKKGSRTGAPERQKPGSTEDKGHVKSNGKPDGVATSQRPTPTRRPNGVVARKCSHIQTTNA